MDSFLIYIFSFFQMIIKGAPNDNPKSKLKLAFDGTTINDVGLVTDPSVRFTWRAPRENPAFPS